MESCEFILKADWVAAIANVVIATGVGVAIFQLITLNKQLKADHERSRRERAVDLLQIWATHLDRKSSAAKKLVEKLDEEQARAIFNQEQLKLDKRHLELLQGCLPNLEIEDDDVKNESILIHESYTSELRWLIVSYLNLLESILAAWHNGIADKEMIESQFQYLVNPAKGHFILGKFRQAAGGVKTFPATAAFVAEITKKDETPNGKEKLPH